MPREKENVVCISSYVLKTFHFGCWIPKKSHFVFALCDLTNSAKDLDEKTDVFFKKESHFVRKLFTLSALSLQCFLFWRFQSQSLAKIVTHSMLGLILWHFNSIYTEWSNTVLPSDTDHWMRLIASVWMSSLHYSRTQMFSDQTVLIAIMKPIRWNNDLE